MGGIYPFHFSGVTHPLYPIKNKCVATKNNNKILEVLIFEKTRAVATMPDRIDKLPLMFSFKPEKNFE